MEQTTRLFKFSFRRSESMNVLDDKETMDLLPNNLKKYIADLSDFEL
jgi:hypothetical protein